MIDKILDRYGNRNGGNGASADQAPEELEVEDLGTFGFLRGSRERATMLELRKKDGSILAIGYGWLEKLEFEPTEGITLHLTEQKISIKGRNLNRETRPHIRLFEAICRHRVPWVREADEPESFAASESAVMIESIEW